MGKDTIPKTKKRIKFHEKYGGLNDTETLKEILYATSLQVEKLEKIRSNTSILVWWLIAIPIVLFVIVVFFGGLGALA
ncbi:MAG: hypothetical protein CMC08_10245 [Flavobacteriaceae bacterium]|nr:hypothetical protein [Flavobacteriaceae bacterium]|tara:strand:- start:828 stop:1061 length:234 start_codon:yes stop_codon:yes gene_type:complete